MKREGIETRVKREGIVTIVKREGLEGEMRGKIIRGGEEIW